VSSAKAAAGYIERGYTVVPVPAGSKNPGRNGWEDLRITLKDVPRYFNNGQNIGIHNGEPSGWLVPVDQDVPEVRKIAGRFLAPTLTSGRDSAPDSHWWFVAPGCPHKTFKDLDGSMLLELRSTGHHTLVEPSVHPSGEPYRWSRNGLQPVEISAEELIRACRELATTALIARHLPEVRDNRTGAGGGRHDLAMAIAGFMLRRGLSEDTVLKILRAAWDARGFGGDERTRREAHRDLEGIVRATVAKLQEDKPATGGKRLEELMPGLRRRIADYWGWSGRLDDEIAQRFNNTDLGNSQRLIAHHGQDLRYCYPWYSWVVWDGSRWVPDNRGEVHRRAKGTVSGIYREAAAAQDEETRKAIAKHAVRSEGEGKIKAMIELAKSEVPVTPDELDAGPWLLNCENGTIDLRTGELCEHRREDLITKLAPLEYDPDAEAPTWRSVLERVLPDREIRAFFKRLCGYALTGDTSEHILPMLYGTGANGKSTVLNALLDTLGDYGTQAAPDLLITKKNSHPTELADLFGMRFVASIEVEDGRRLAESLVKQLTGGDRIKARKMRQDFWEFAPTHKVLMAVNHKPTVRGTDNAIWRRISLIPFTETIPPEEQDKKLPEKLCEERPGILAWAVEGCLEWQREGLQAPEEVRRATGEYRAEMDVLGAFLKECCKQGPDENEAAGDLYETYKLWCQDGGERAETQRRFGTQLKERGFERYRGGANGGHRWRRVSLLTHWKERISRDSDPSDPKVSFTAKKSKSRGENGNLGSEGSEGSVKLKVEDVRALISRTDTGPGRAYSHYLGMPSDQRLEYLVKAILHAKKLDSSEWERYRSVVLEASAGEDA
jgi:putative DNA primase/helicase